MKREDVVIGETYVVTCNSPHFKGKKITVTRVFADDPGGFACLIKGEGPELAFCSSEFDPIPELPRLSATVKIELSGFEELSKACLETAKIASETLKKISELEEKLQGMKLELSERSVINLSVSSGQSAINSTR